LIVEPEIFLQIPIQLYLGFKYMYIHPNIIGAFVILGIVFGTIECFFGYRVFKVILGIIGFVCGFTMTSMMGYTMAVNGFFLYLMGIISGMLGAAMMIWLYFFGVFFIGAMLGGVVGATLFGVINLNPNGFILLVLSIIFGALALVFQRYMIIIATAFIGSWHMVVGIACLFEGKSCLADMTWLLKIGSSHNYLVTLMWLILGFLGCFVQSRQDTVLDYSQKS
jgi:hypothetical protein